MLVTKKAPDFTATAVLGDGSIVEDFNLYSNPFAIILSRTLPLQWALP